MKVLMMLEEVAILEDVRNLASDEDIQKWQTAIAGYLVNVTCNFKDFQKVPNLKIVDWSIP
ncbi:MAG: hypothetical protein KME40_23610 [Komarekiella atlantica HA4396-MV6]|nr:hypothetical protein [Komarekiella atlantica HA4396-MV6]